MLRHNKNKNYYYLACFCSCPQPPTPPVCDEATGTVIQSNAYCGYIQDASGPFAECISFIGQEIVNIYMDNCVYDVCAVYGGDEAAKKTAKCGDLAAFAESCSAEGFSVASDWTTTSGCGMYIPTYNYSHATYAVVAKIESLFVCICIMRPYNRLQIFTGVVCN